MVHSIATRKITALLSAIAWSALVVQGTSYGQPPVAEGKMYWTALERGIYRSSLDVTNIEQLVKPEWSHPGSIALDVPGGKMYWTDERVSGGIYRSSLDGTKVETLLGNKWTETPLGDKRIRLLGFASSTKSIALDVAEGKMYWTEVLHHGDYIDGIVARSNLDGSNIEILFEGLYPWDIALDLVRGKVYWTDLDYDGIFRADLDGQNVEYDYIRSGSPRDIALDVDRGKIYWTGWTDAGAILRADLNGQNIEEILTVSDSYPEEITLDVDRGKIYWTNTYWTNPTTQTIHRADLDGQNIEHLFDSADDVKREIWGPRVGITLDVNGGKMYWTNSGPGTIQRADLDGENREILFDPLVRKPYGIALYIDKIYWTDVVKGTIQRADLNGQNIEVLITGLNRPKDIALLDGDKIYWADEGAGVSRADPETGKIQQADLDGSNVKDVLTGLSYPKDIALDPIRSKLYWTDTDVNLTERIIHRADLDGANVEDISTGLAPFSSVEIALDLDADKLYWTDQGTGTIQRADLDGTNVEGIFSLPDTDWSSLGAIALDSVGNKIYWGVLASAPSIDPVHTPAPRWLEIFRANLDGSQVKEIYYGFRVEGYSPAQTSIALYIPHPTAISTPATPSAIPATSGLSPNYPNPFNASTQIAYRLATPGPVRLTIYNTLGQPVRTLVDQFQTAGFYQVRWDARDRRGTALAAGVYLVRLHYPGGEQTRRLLLLK